MASLKLGVYVPPMLATVTDEVPTADGWACEVKWDGVRAQLHVVDGQPRLFTRRGRDVTTLVPELRGMETLAGDASIIDGELVAQEADGSTSFQGVMTRLVSRGPRVGSAALTFVAFDVLMHAGTETIHLPYEGRRRLLAQRARMGASWYVPQHHIGDSIALFLETCRRGLEGLVMKRLTDAYRPGARVDGWRKVQNRNHPAYQRVSRAHRRGG